MVRGLGGINFGQSLTNPLQRELAVGVRFWKNCNGGMGQPLGIFFREDLASVKDNRNVGGSGVGLEPLERLGDGSKVRSTTECKHFDGDRELVRELTVAHALQGVRERIA
jgi:hypothetical protein